MSVYDSASASDTASVSILVPVQDSGTGADVLAAITNDFGFLADAGVGVDIITLSGTFDLTDSGVGQEYVVAAPYATAFVLQQFQFGVR